MEAPAITNRQRELVKEHVRGLCLLDDALMTKCFEDNRECTELVLRIVMGIDDLVVTDVHTQHVIKSLQGRSVQLDIRARDGAGREYDIEVQRATSGAAAKRARYNSSVMDANSLLAGESWANLPETYVIVIAEHDVFKHGLAVYHITRRIEETGEPFGDESHIPYVNASRQDDTPLDRLMHDFACTDPEAMHYRILADRIRYFKEDEGGIERMSDSYQRFIDEVCVPLAKDMAEQMAPEMARDMAKGMAEGMAEGMARDMAERMAKGMAAERLSETDERVRRFADSLVADGKITEQEAAHLSELVRTSPAVEEPVTAS